MILNRIKLDPDPDPELSIVEKNIGKSKNYPNIYCLCFCVGKGDTKEYSK